MKNLRIFLLVLIIIGLALLATQKIWVPKLVDRIIQSEKTNPTAIVTPVPENPQSKFTYKNASSDLVRVTLPFPDAVVGRDFSVIGEARGQWFFEANAPIQILDSSGNVLVNGYAMAQGEWMTTEFVPFKGDIKIPEFYTGKATLVFMKDNPSDLRENDASVSFPINISY